MTKKLAIVNRISCSRRSSSSIKSLIGRIKKELTQDIIFTEYPGHAEKAASDASEYDIIIAVGGDGTISEIVNGMDLETQALAIMPLGTGNSFARDLGIASLTKAFEAIRKNEIIKIDLINCRFEINDAKFERYVIATSGLGFASRTAAFANRYLKMTGPFCYPLSACLKLFNQEVVSAKVRVDNSALKDIKFTIFFINNTRHAGNTCIFPKANLKDSEFNLLFARTNALTQYLWNIGVITKTYFYYPGEKAANKLHITLDKPSTFMLDGEIFDSVKEIGYSVIPRKLTVFK